MAVYVDLNGGLDRLRGNKAIYKKMLGLFMSNAEFENLKTAIAAGDWARGSDAAHAIKGMTGNLSMPELFEVSTLLMNQMRQGAPDTQCVERYNIAYEQTRAEVQKLIDTL